MILYLQILSYTFKVLMKYNYNHTYLYIMLGIYVLLQISFPKQRISFYLFPHQFINFYQFILLNLLYFQMFHLIIYLSFNY